MAKNKKPAEENVKQTPIDTIEENCNECTELSLQDAQTLATNLESCTTSNFTYGVAESLWLEDLDNRILYIDGEITSDIFREIDVYIIKFNSADKNIPVDKRIPIKLIINSGGGSVFDGLATINCIKNSITPVIGICTGYAYSMAFHIFINCHKRYASKNSTFLYHDGEECYITSSTKLRDLVKFADRVDVRLDEMFAERTKITMNEIQNIKRIENFYFGDEAYRLGIVDEIIGEDISIEDILAYE